MEMRLGMENEDL